MNCCWVFRCVGYTLLAQPIFLKKFYEYFQTVVFKLGVWPGRPPSAHTWDGRDQPLTANRLGQKTGGKPLAVCNNKSNNVSSMLCAHDARVPSHVFTPFRPPSSRRDCAGLRGSFPPYASGRPHLAACATSYKGQGSLPGTRPCPSVWTSGCQEFGPWSPSHRARDRAARWAAPAC